MLKPLTIAWCLCVITASVPMYSHAGSVYLQENAKLANGKPLPILEGKLGAAKNVHKLEGL